MIDIEQIVRRAREMTNCGRPILAAPFELPKELCRSLIDRDMIVGYVADHCSNDPSISGWWIDRKSGRWELRRSASRELLFLGTDVQIGGRMLLAARRVGIKVVYLLDAASEKVQRLDVVRALASRTFTGLMSRALENRTIGNAVGGLSYTNRSYESAFDDLLQNAGGSFRLKREEFIPGRALLILGSLGPGGAERQAALTAVELAKHGRWQPIIGCSYLEGGDADFHLPKVLTAGVRAEVVPQFPSAINEPWAQNILVRANQYRHIGFQSVAHVILSYACFIRELRPTLVQTWMDYANVLAGIAAELVGVPAIVLNGRSVAPDNFGIFQPYMRPGYLALLRQARVIFTNNSRTGARDYARWLGIDERRFEVLPNGLEFPEARPEREASALRRSLGIPEGAPIVGSIIRFSEEKQPELWIETAIRSCRRHPSVYFVAFGGGPLLEAVRRRVADAGLADRIQLPGVTKDPWPALTMMSVFLLTSRMEGLPNVLLEAQAMGVPVITTGRGGMSETYVEGQTGFTVETATADDLADRIEALLNDPAALRNAGQHAVAHVRSTFSVDRMIKRTLGIFDAA